MMTIKCPKCGFSQPRDQYCARCGVDMLAFKAPPKPLMKRLSENLALQIFLVLLIGLFGLFYIRKNSKDRLQARVNKTSTLQMESDSGHQFDSGSQPANYTNNQAYQDSSNQTVAEKSAVETDKNQRPEVKVYFIQVATATLSQWVESESISRIETSEGLMMGYISEFSKVMANSASSTRVLKAEPFPIVTDQVFLTKIDLPRPTGTNDSRQIAGTGDPKAAPVTAMTRLDSVSDDSVAGQLEVVLDQENRFPVDFDLAYGSAMILTGFATAKTPEKTPETELVVVISLKK